MDSKGRPLTNPKKYIRRNNFYKSLYDTDNSVSDNFDEEFVKPYKIPQINDNS